jgi:microcystin-dependent protein
MAQPYLGEIRMFGGNFAPAGWMFCDGSLLPISENETLFNIIGITYGGDGQSTFALPDMRGRIPIEQGNGFALAQMGGSEQVTLIPNQIPVHTHPLLGSTSVASDVSASNNVRAQSLTFDGFLSGGPAQVNMAPQSISNVGGSQPHSNMQPYLCVTFIISLYGIFPSPT